MIRKRHANLAYRLIVLLVAALFLGGCLSEDDSCEEILVTAGEPDMTASPVFLLATVAPGADVDVNIAVDDETLGGTVYLLPVGSQDVATQVATMPVLPVMAGAAETVTVTLTVDAAAAADTYYPVVVLCNIADAAACTIGAGYTEDISGILAEQGNYVRGTANGGTVDLSSLQDACFAVNTVAVL